MPGLPHQMLSQGSSLQDRRKKFDEPPMDNETKHSLANNEQTTK